MQPTFVESIEHIGAPTDKIAANENLWKRNKIYKRMGYDLNKGGIRGAPAIRFVVSEDIHPANIVALRYMGYGTDNLEFVPVDDQGRIRVSEIPRLDENTIVIAQAGNINSGAFYLFPEICDLARSAGAWVHVDGAFGGWLRISEKRSHLAKGMELADSWSLDCHKWLNVPYDSAVAICRDPEAMQQCFGVSASYLLDTGPRIPSHFTPELSRRARGVDIWATLKFLGKKGFADVVDRCCDQALWFSKQLEKLGFTLMNEVCINQVVLSLQDDDGIQDEERLRAIMTRVQDSGHTWFGPTKWQGQNVYRMSICSAATNEKDLKIALQAISRAMSDFDSRIHEVVVPARQVINHRRSRPGFSCVAADSRSTP